jgi:hypothetical protein
MIFTACQLFGVCEKYEQLRSGNGDFIDKFRTPLVASTEVFRTVAPTRRPNAELRTGEHLQRESPSSPFVFVSERSTPFTTAGFDRMIERAARRGLGLELKAHPLLGWRGRNYLGMVGDIIPEF